MRFHGDPSKLAHNDKEFGYIDILNEFSIKLEIPV